MKSDTRQWLCKHVFTAPKHVATAIDTHATREELLDAVFSVRTVQRTDKWGYRADKANEL
jgi:hypothetical protein